MNPPEEYVNNNSGELVKGGSNQLASNGIGEINNLDKVRDILFGSQAREFDKRFTRLEDRLVKEVANARDETKKRLDALEHYVKQEVDSLTERLKNEQTERENKITALTEEQKNITLSLEKKINQFDEHSTNSQRELREQILDQSKSLQDDIQQKYTEILTLLERENQEIRRNKTDRSHLAALFTDLAIRLSSENKPEF